MSNMTDAEAINTIDAYLPRHCRAALDHIAARLRGEAAQCATCGGSGFIDHNLGAGIGRITEDEFCPECEGDTKRRNAAQGEQQAVAWASPEGMERLRTQDDSATVVPEAFRDSRHTIPLYDRPQPVAVAGNAAIESVALLFTRSGNYFVGGDERVQCLEKARAAVRILSAAAPAPVAGDAVSLGWRVRERRSADGQLLDCFVEQPAGEGQAYGLEVLGDDYTGFGDVEAKLAHCQMIVSWANAALAQVQDAAPSAPVGDDRWKTLIGKWQRRAEAVGYDGVEDALGAAIAAKSAPAPVAGDAVAALLARWRELLAASWSSKQDLRPVRFVQELEAALAQDRASQGAASSAPVGVECNCPGEGKTDPSLHAPNCPVRLSQQPAAVDGAILAAVEAEREACAKACDDRAAYYHAGDDDGPNTRRGMACEACASVIRWRSTVSPGVLAKHEADIAGRLAAQPGVRR